MEEQQNTNQTEATTNKKERPYYSIENWLSKMELAFSNAKLPEINSQLAVLGYTDAKLNALLAKVKELETLHQKQRKEYAEQYSETAKLEAQQKQVNTLYMKHLGLCRILFKSNVKAHTALGFSGKRKTAYGDWFQQISNFYSQLLNTQEFLEALKEIGIQKAELQSVQTQLEQVSQLKKSQKKETAEAQKATETRDKAFDELYPLYSELIAYAKVLLTDEQHLEAMGIVVKR